MHVSALQFSTTALRDYADMLTPDARALLTALAPLDAGRQSLMAHRTARRLARARTQTRLDFLPDAAVIAGTGITVADARAGRFEGGAIPADLKRQWIQGTGPAARPRSTLAQSLRNVAYALLSGADGWMFDGEDALGQLDTMSLDNQRSLRCALHREPLFLEVATRVAAEMNQWATGFLGRAIVDDAAAQLQHTTVIFRARGLHLDDRHVCHADGTGLGASLVDAALYVWHNHAALRSRGASIVLYLPKIQTAEDAAYWNRLLSHIEQHVGLPPATIRTYVLVEQIEACFQLMEIRAALSPRFVGFNTGRWDYINSVSDALAWDAAFVNPNIDAVTMTYGYMRAYEDRVRRAVNTPDALGQCALWQGGMEPNIPVGSAAGVEAGMARALAGAAREQREGASGKWVAHWKMVHIVRPVWARAGADNQLGRAFAPLDYTPAAAAALTAHDSAPRTVRGARDLISVAVQYGNAFLQGMQAAALKPADFFGNDDVLYLMEDMATGEIRVSILWEWLHKQAPFTEADPATGVQVGDVLTPALFNRLLEEEMTKLHAASSRDVHDTSKRTTLPIAEAIVRRYVGEPVKMPWYIDLLNATLGVTDGGEAHRRIALVVEAFEADGTRVTRNLDFERAGV
ncbi:MAG: malate synthase [Acidobacteria bacterium]|nr:malate synthase [Acidobacteriota bacterium]